MPRRSREDWKTYKNVFDGFTERILIKLQGQGHFDELLRPVTLGKEANIFIASKKDDFVIVKIYRTMNANFNKMHDYLVHDERYQDVKANKRKVIFSWVQREFANLLIAREAIAVPTPFVVNNNVLVMELIGHADEPAPMLKDQSPVRPVEFYNKVLSAMEALREAGLVHGDLSAFNILNREEEPIFIDFSQATTARSLQADVLFERDLKNINIHFEKLGVKTR